MVHHKQRNLLKHKEFCTKFEFIMRSKLLWNVSNDFSFNVYGCELNVLFQCFETSETFKGFPELRFEQTSVSSYPFEKQQVSVSVNVSEVRAGK